MRLFWQVVVENTIVTCVQHGVILTEIISNINKRNSRIIVTLNINVNIYN